MTERMLRLLIRLVLAAALFASLEASAFHFPWDQGHDTTDWNDPSNPGPCEGPNCDPCKSTGSPVYIPTGHLVWTETDVVLKGRPYLAIARTYNSHDPRDGLFGNGWSVGCDVGLYLADDGTTTKYVLRQANGKRYEFLKDTDGVFRPPPGRFEVLTPQPGGGATLVYLDAARQTFNSAGRLVSQQDANGNAVTYSYDGGGRLTRLADGNGRFLALSYNSRGRISTVRDHASRTWQYEYDSAGDLIGVTDPAGGVRAYTYAAYTPPGDGQTYQHLTQITDQAGVVITKVTYTSERVASYSEGTNILTYSYNVSARTVSVRDSVGSIWTYTYSSEGLTTQLRDPTGHTVQYSYDANGREVQVIDEAGATWNATHDALGRVVTQSNPLGETTSYLFEGSSPYPVGVTSPTGRFTQMAYDARLNLVTLRDPSGAMTSMEWSSQGDLVTLIDANGGRRTASYDAIGLPVAVTDPVGRTARSEYDSRGNLTAYINAAGERIETQYDALDRPVRVVDPLGQASTIAYDAAGRITAVTDPNGAVTGFEYDSSGRLSRRTSPDERVWVHSYRSDNLPSQVLLPDARTIAYSYDTLKRLTSESGSGSSFTYTARGEIASASASGGTVSRSYDLAGRLIQEAMWGQTVAIQRNADGERTRQTALGLVTDYTRDARGLVASIAQGSESFAFTYDALGQRTRLVRPNGSTDYRYDAAHRLVELTHDGPFTARFSATYDVAGRIASVNGEAGGPWSYAYDALGRLTSAVGPGGSFAYSYDPLGNIQGNSRAYNSANQLTTDAQFDYSYDPNGNLTEKRDRLTSERTVYRWNAKGQLLAHEHYPPGGSTPDGQLNFTYDALGRRASKTQNGVVERYVYDGLDLIGVLNASGQVVSRFVFGPTIDEPLAISSADGVRYFHANHLGSVMALSSASAVAASYDYEPFGRTAVVGEVRNPFHYTGREQDGEDLYFYRARYFDPVNRRFLSPDPLGLSTGLNLYAYVENDPINRRDPLGLWAGIDDLVFTGGGALAGLVGQGVSDLLSGQLSGWEDYTGAAIGGAVLGETLLYAGPVVAGAAGGLATNLAKQGLKNLSGKQCGFNPVSAATDTVIGAATGLIPGVRVPGVTAGRNSMNAIYRQMSTKFANGTINNVSGQTALKMFGGRAVDTALLPGTAAGALAGSYASPFVPGYSDACPCQ
jgi:RHS repeat-associated protein